MKYERQNIGHCITQTLENINRNRKLVIVKTDPEPLFYGITKIVDGQAYLWRSSFPEMERIDLKFPIPVSELQDAVEYLQNSKEAVFFINAQR